MKQTFFLLALSATIAIKVFAAPMTAPTFAVKGDVTKPTTWTVAQLQKLAPAQSIATTLKGKPYRAKGVSLWAVVRAASPTLDKKTKHAEAHYMVMARGKDSYTATFAWPELMPDVGGKVAFVVWEESGKPLPAKEGAFRLVVPSDKKPMRWVYNLSSLEIYDASHLGH